MREASTCSPPTSTFFQVLNGKPSFETSSLVSAERMSRARGPQRPTVHHVDVRSSIFAEPSFGRWSANHFLSAMPCAPPVTTRHVHLPRGDLLYDVERARALHVKDRERGQVEHRCAVAHREVLGVDDRRPPARVPLVLTPLDAVLLD